MGEVVLKEIGSNKVKVIKIYREVTGLGLGEAKEIIDAVQNGVPAKINVDSVSVSSVIARFNEVGASAAVASDSRFDSGLSFNKAGSQGSFKMIVEDLYSMTGRGIVATGHISSGLIRLNDLVEIFHSDGNSITATVVGIEQSSNLVKKAKSGENVGLLLGGIERSQIVVGDSITRESFVATGSELHEEKSWQEAVSSEKNTTFPSGSTNLPTASPQNREETLNMLYEVGRIAEKSESLEEEIGSIAATIDSEKCKAEELRHIVSSKAKTIKWITILCSLITWPFLTVFGVIITIIIWVVMNKTVIKKDLQEHEAENNANAERYISEHVEPLKNHLREVRIELEKLNASGQIEWAKDIVGENLFYSVCIGDLYDLVKNRRADSLKEALNLYDDAQYKARMEERQAAIQNASEATAAEAAKQTAYAKEVAKNTHQTATAAKATAYHTRQISKNTRRFR